MLTFSHALLSAGISCLCVLVFRLLLPGHGGFGSLFRSEQEPQAGAQLGGVFFLLSVIAGTVFGGGSLSGSSVFCLLITAGAALIGFIDDLIARQDKRGEGIVPWLKALLLLVLSLAAALNLSVSEGIGRVQVLPISCRNADFRGWYILLALPLLLGRFTVEKQLCESALCCHSYCLTEAAFWCFAYCLAGETGAFKWFNYRSAFSGMAAFSGAVAGALLGIGMFNPLGKALRLGSCGYWGVAAALSLMALCSGWLILLPLAALWPFLCGVFALMKRFRTRKGEKEADYRFAQYFLSRGMSEERLQSLIRWLSLLGALAAAVLYTL